MLLPAQIIQKKRDGQALTEEEIRFFINEFTSGELPDYQMSALAMAELAHRAGIPKGVFNVVPSKRASKVGLELTQNPLVRKFSFTGSTAVGKTLMAQCATTVKKVSLELGGNAPFIVFDDANIDEAVDGAMIAKMRNGGQACTATNRFYVQKGVLKSFTDKLTARMVKGGKDWPGPERWGRDNMWIRKDEVAALAKGQLPDSLFEVQ